VGLFGNLGSGNIGNDASMEAVLGYLRAEHPDAVVDAFAAGAQGVTGRYGIPASPLFWYQKYQDRVSGLPAVPLKVLGKGIDLFRIAGWVRGHDAVIVPGMGVLEASLPLRPWGFPYAMLVLGASGRLFGTKVALVSVGAGVINQPLTRWLLTRAARLAFYRSYRNAGSRDVMRQRGLDTSRDPVYPDLAFALPAPSHEPGDEQVVCLGVMEYHGSNDDRARADEIRSAYLDGMKRFARWLVDNGYTVRLTVGDTNGSDDAVVQEILADVRESRPGLDPARVTAQPVVSYADVMAAMLPAGSVVAIRFHNILAALKLGKPTIGISYSPKHDALMAEMGLSGFCQPVNPFDYELLVQRFTELTSRSAELRKATAERSEANQKLLRQQFSELSAVLFPAHRPAPAAEHETSTSNGINARR
jgi:polysaccharide pyruvyl transferase WcaK-like protein